MVVFSLLLLSMGAVDRLSIQTTWMGRRLVHLSITILSLRSRTLNKHGF
jgi:hypothetical protein